MPTVNGGPADLIALAWYQLGYRPQDSVLLVGLHGQSQRAGAVVRGDLPRRGAEAASLAAMAHPLLRAGAVAVVLVVCSEEACSSLRPRVVRAAHRLLPQLGLEVIDALGVSGDRYRSYDCFQTACCPPQGRPVQEVFDSATAAELVLAGHTLAASEGALVADVDVEPQPGQPVADAEAPNAGAPDAGASAPDRAPDPAPDRAPDRAPDPAAVFRHWRAALNSAGRPEAGGAEAGGADPWLIDVLGRAMRDSRLRDAVMLTLVPGSGELPERLLAGASITRPGDDLLAAALAIRPQPDLLRRGVGLLAAAARAAPQDARAEPLAALAWLAWWGGDGGRARLLVQRALQARPGHGLALLVGRMLEFAVPPPWAESADQRPASGW